MAPARNLGEWGLNRVVLALASSNLGKLREFQALLSGLSLKVTSVEQLGGVVFPEEGTEYAPNAIAKARAAAMQLDCWAVADDSGLEVEGLDGAPGALSARYGGPDLDDGGRVDHLLAELALRPEASRRARFVCVAALASPQGEVHTERGECSGRILPAPRGGGGFGYDPVFEPKGYTGSMAELSSEQKEAISHRGRALRRLRPAIEVIPPGPGAD